MSDDAVATLLRSDQPLVLIEAAAGCGKTYQGASYARDVSAIIGDGRLLILTHTHAACSVFAERTKGAGSKVEIKTIDGLITQIATAYHQTLGLPSNLSLWAWQNNGNGFSIMAAKVAAFLGAHPMVAKALATRYPVVVCDEHQDSSADQHEVVMALYRNGATLRIFGDPLQRIYGGKTAKEAKADQDRWEALKQAAACESLDTPHRWQTGCPELGEWIRLARESLRTNKPIDLTGPKPDSLTILIANNTARQHGGYILSKDQRKPIDRVVTKSDQLMILASQNELIAALRAFWMRRIPIWEGHTRDALAKLVSVVRDKQGDAEGLAQGLIEFFAEIARRRSYSRPSPHSKTLSSIHKAKGLECDHAMVMACDRTQFSSTLYAKCKLYVAISRAKRSLTLVVPDSNTSPLLRI